MAFYDDDETYYDGGEEPFVPEDPDPGTGGGSGNGDDWEEPYVPEDPDPGTGGGSGDGGEDPIDEGEFWEEDPVPENPVPPNESDYTNYGILRNPTLFPAAPIVRIYGRNGSVGLGGGSITVTDLPSQFSYVDVDCDISNARSGGTNCNRYVTIIPQADKGKLLLEPGENRVNFTSGISKVVITPRWWRL